MTAGNKGFAGLIAGGGEGALTPRRPPRTGFLEGRDNRLSELATGGLINRSHEAVDPAVCRIWEGHNRDYAALSEQACGDLLESLRAQGRQEVPAIVRRVTGDPQFKFEVICGARRHWSVSWLRSHGYADFKFVVEPRELSDEEAFRVADLENRSRKDLSDYERAADYARAVERYYEGSQQRMVERLGVTKSWLSRYLELAKLPPEVLDCFESRSVIGISHAAALAPALSHPHRRKLVLNEAQPLRQEQQRRIEAGQRALGPAQVIARLVGAPTAKAPPAAGPVEMRDDHGRLFLKMTREARGGVSFLIPSARAQNLPDILAAVEKCLTDLQSDR
jgi:ParB family chromosome partitioning protein